MFRELDGEFRKGHELVGHLVQEISLLGEPYPPLVAQYQCSYRTEDKYQ